MKIRKSILIILMLIGWALYHHNTSSEKSNPSSLSKDNDYLQEYFFSQWIPFSEEFKEEKISLSFPSAPILTSNEENYKIFNARYQLADYSLKILNFENIDDAMLYIDKEIEVFEEAPHARILHVDHKKDNENYIINFSASNPRNPYNGDEIIYQMKFIATNHNLYVISTICEYDNIEYHDHFADSFKIQSK